MFDTIVVATDGSTHGSRAIDMAREMAQDGDHQLVIVHVVEMVGGKGGVVSLLPDEEQLRANLEAEAADLCAAGVKTTVLTPHVRMSGPAHAISEAADEVGADVIVVGRRGHSVVSEVVLGGVPVRLMQIAHCPVLVVPPARDADS